MANKKFPKSELPIRKSSELLPLVFQTPANEKFMEAVVDPLIQPGVLEKTVGYIGRRYGKTYRGADIYLDTDNTLRSRYQLEPAVISKNKDKIDKYYDYIDFKNQLKFFRNNEERDYLATDQEHYSWNPPINWDMFVNYREYYWVPSGPPPVFVIGNKPEVVSSYKVVLGIQSSFVFRSDKYVNNVLNNPTITLYRGQTYKFKVNAPGQGFVIRTNYDSASLRFNNNKTYSFGNLTVYDDKVWRSLGEVPAGNPPYEGSPYWAYVDIETSESVLDYNKGVTNNGTENGTVTFKVPYDAPDFLYYQSKVDADRLGQFIVADIEENTTIDVEREIVGKVAYTSGNDVEFSNGLIVEFRGRVAPEKYSKDLWIVEGVGESIRLIKFSDLQPPTIKNKTLDVVFDNAGFDTEPFDDAVNYPGTKDYFTINRSSIDSNAWSRYNRWFHRSVLEFAYKFRGQDFPAEETERAKRPIIEFLPNLQLFNHGAVAKQSVDYIEDYTTDIFSTIEGSDGYIVDGEQLFDGARLLVISDTDNLVNNKIFIVKFITHLNRRQITLREADDSISYAGECVLVTRGKKNARTMYHFTGEKWVKSQEKLAVNQSPLYDVFDENGVSFSDPLSYPINNFKGTTLLSYKNGNGIVDKELGISLSYLNINNVGDIEFVWNWGSDSFLYTKDQKLTEQEVSRGYFKFNPNEEYQNGWIKTDNKFIQPIIDSVVLLEDSNFVVLESINWEEDPEAVVNFYLNGLRILEIPTRNNNTFSFEKQFNKNDVISVKIITTAEPKNGYYEIPVGLEKNPLNKDPETFTLGQAADHIATSIEFNNEFRGVIPGKSNLRDISDYRQHAKRFMKHSSIAPLSIFLISDKEHNVVKSLQQAKKVYSTFKNSFLTRATELPFNDIIPDFVDDILADLSRTKNQDNAFFDSDMVGLGAYTSIDYVVEDEGIKTFALSSKFTLTEQSRRAVYVYLNGEQLLNGRDYNFNNTFGFITITAPIEENDVIQIREYVSTSSCFIPATPTKLGLYKKYTPMKFVDDTYREPREVIQGHDGSLTFTYGDYRDDLLLELEYRIYNNIKQEYDETIFDVDKIIGGYYGNAQFTKEQLDSVVNQEFLRWIRNTDINYTLNNYFIDTEPFTYTYSNMTDPTGTKNLPGWWRGVYQWFYDTDRPHRCPWEMLGFSQQPDWWESEYGPAPYTSNNLILWEDLANGLIKHGNREGIHDRYKRPTLINHIPVDGDGNLLDPLNSGLAGNFVLVNNKGNFKFGDINPVEYAWRSSSDWPFSLTIALCLLKPFDFITRNFDRTQVKVNEIGQTVSVISNKFLTLNDIEIPSLDRAPSAGLVNYLVDYIKLKRIAVAELKDKIANLDVNLSSRLSGFVDKSQQKYLLDSRNPRSTSGSVFVPPENYDIIFNVSTPIYSVAYSGVILEKTEGGWIVNGYDDLYPFFTYYPAVPNQKDPVITVGGVSETFVDWQVDTTFNNGQVVRYKNNFYRATKTHRSSGNFEELLWRKLPNLPTVGGITASRRRNFNKLVTRKLSYGSKFTTIQDVVDFLLGYEQHLLSQGFKFDRYDTENQVGQNWLTSCKEFMFWTTHNWAVGSLITLSPAAVAVDVVIPVGVADNLLDSFYDYQIYKSDGTVLDPRYINVNRTFQNLTIETTDTTEGIYFVKVNYVLKEHVVVFSDKTVFNDVIYDETTGYRQERIKTQGFRTTDWDGDYTSPGFLFDNVNIESWQPFTDYKLGDIVEYQSRYWTSQKNQLASEEFDTTTWSKLDLIPEKQLVANFDYKINQFDDYYDATSDGVGQSQRTLARHAIGYQERKYLQELAEDSVTQFQLYQGFIREKGTSNAIKKVFDKLSKAKTDSVILNEEWAFRVGRLGGIDQIREIEFKLTKDNFVLDPQPIIVTQTSVRYPDDQYYRIPSDDFTIKPFPYNTDINITSIKSNSYKTSMYVRTDQVEHIVSTRDQILELDISTVKENDHIWITFDTSKNNLWTVLRINESPFVITDVKKEDNTAVIFLDRAHDVEVGEIIGIRNIKNLTGFFKVIETNTELLDSSSTLLTVEIKAGAEAPSLIDDAPATISLFSKSRFESYKDVDPSVAALLQNDSKLWIDNNGENLWEVVQKKKQYSSTMIGNYGGLENLNINNVKTGTKVLYDSVYKRVYTSIPELGYVLAYADSIRDLPIRNIIQSPQALSALLGNSFGKSMALSPDSRWLAITAPNASNIKSNYRGSFIGGNKVLSEIEIGQRYRILPDVNVLSVDWESIGASEKDIGDLEIGKEYLISKVDFEYIDRNNVTQQYINSNWSSVGGSSSVSEGDFFIATSTGVVSPLSLEVGRPYKIKKIGNTDWNFIAGTADKTYSVGDIIRVYQNEFGDRLTVTSITSDGALPQSTITVIVAGGTGPTVGNLIRVSNASDPAANGTFTVLTTNSPTLSIFTYLANGYIPNGNIQTDTLSVKKGSTGVAAELGRAIETIFTPNSLIQGDLELMPVYRRGDIVFHDESILSVDVDFDAEIDNFILYSDNFSLADSVSFNQTGCNPGYDNQGAVFIYEYKRTGSSTGSWNLTKTILSPEISSNENFGYSVVIGQDDTGYNMAVSAVGSETGKGKVYLYEYDGTWKHKLNQDGSTQYGPIVELNLQDSDDSPADEKDWFGFSLAINKTGSVLVVGAPQSIDDSEDNKGKVFVYKKDENGHYNAAQIISATTLLLIDDSDSAGVLGAGDQFGYSVDLDETGSTLVIGCPEADLFNNDQGAVYVLKLDEGEYRLKQKIFSYEIHPEEFFGKSIAITPDNKKIVVGASNRFYNDDVGFAGSVYVFERKDNTYFLTEKLETDFSYNESFGFSVDASDSAIAVGSPNYSLNEKQLGTVRLFKKQENVNPWEIIAIQQPTVDIDKIKSISLYDTENRVKIGDVDFIDPAKLKILNIAEQEITYKTFYDPAVYSVGADEELQTIDPITAWTNQHVGELWWDLSTAKWVYYEQGDTAYRAGNWSSLAYGASIDVYEWVESVLQPSDWAILADTNEGLAENISGQPLYPDNSVYSVKELYNEYTGETSSTLYYYWVKNTVVVPANVVGRRIPAKEVASLISNPKGSGEKFLAFIDSDKLLAYNFQSSVTKSGTVINIEYYKDTANVNPVHNEYKLLTEGVPDNLPPISLETKWIDSLVGYDLSRNPVPDRNLPVKQRYGISFRPRQSMFVDRVTALRVVIDNINSVLLSNPFVDFISMGNLSSFDDIPDSILNLYDDIVDTNIDLTAVVTSRLKQAVITATILDGEIDSLEIVNPGFGYKVPPPVFIDGDGRGAKIELTLDLKGRVKAAKIVSRGKRYTTATVEVRPFSVLVNSDSDINGEWSIYAWDDQRKVFYRTRSKSFDTRKYWFMIDWWANGYNKGSRIVKEIVTVAEESTIVTEVGDLIRIKEYGTGGWAVFKRIDSTSDLFLERYSLVGRENGTIQLDEKLYNNASAGIGYDAYRSFDIGEYDIENFIELRNILKAVKEDIFVGDYSVEWNKLFFASIRYVFSEQQYVDWAFKTSFLNAIHNVGDFEQKISYKNDNLSSYQDYIHEVKPYRTTIREYVSKYNQLEFTNTALTDFDLPAVYSKVDGKIIPVTEVNDLIKEYPWKWWLDNHGYSLVDIKITNPGDDYVQPPSVLIETAEGDAGAGAAARAYISSGKVTAIVLLNGGKGYTKPPRISLVGGNGSSVYNAEAIAFLGDGKVRNFKLDVKFDRITKNGSNQYYTQEESFKASGYNSVFDLSYPSSLDKTKIQILKNNQVVLNDEYKVTLFKVVSDGYTYYRGKITFTKTPLASDIIKVTYEKDDTVLDSINRINKYYTPKAGMKGKDPSQLMTGIDFGGVEVQGSSFGLTGGWDSLPWYTDAWDAIDPSGDYYYVVVPTEYNPEKIYKPGAIVQFQGKIFQLFGNNVSQGEIPGESDAAWGTIQVKLPFTPAAGKEINVYRNLKNTDINYDSETTYQFGNLVRFQGEYFKCISSAPIVNMPPVTSFTEWKMVSETYRVDDPAWDSDDSSSLSNKNALMPTFIGDGSSNGIEVGIYFEVLPREVLIFRPEESDGSNVIFGNDVIDTNLTGGSLAEMSGAYSTAQGITSDDIVVEGGVYISPDFVPAPEENVPGQVLDSVSIKVFQRHLDDETLISAFEIHKDMMNIHHYKRYSIGRYTLTKDLTYYDLDVNLNTSIGLASPIPQTNSPGMLSIRGERIEFLEKQDTKLSKLRRGVQGSSIAEVYPQGTAVANISYDQTIPYKEDNIRIDFFYDFAILTNGVSNVYTVTDPKFVGGITTSLINDEIVYNANKENIVIKITYAKTGETVTLNSEQYEVEIENTDSYLIIINQSVSIESNDRVIVYPLLVGPLEFIPTVTTASTDVENSWFRETIPKNYGQCDEIELFVGGRRKYKSPVNVYDETLGFVSPSSDTFREADFSVNGKTAYIRLTEPVENAGTRITIIKRTGKLWYERGETTASNGTSLLENQTTPARFIAQKTTNNPE